ncbi:MAG: DUF2007 domain-containing protein [Muribaculaceae bacterium]|nr:DUF2007 domain-containing protein [Muribaculaceae bacterium]
MSEERFTCIGEYNDEREASIVAGMLVNNGIDAYVDGSIMTTIYAAGSTWAPVRVMVPSDRAAEAAALLREHRDM